MDRCTRALFVAAGALLIVLMAAPSARAESRGELLYRTHCIACHTTQVHWRDRKLATDWASLRGEVRRWQADAQLGWSEADVLDVTRYLNDTIYRFPPPARPLGAWRTPAGGSAAMASVEAGRDVTR